MDFALTSVVPKIKILLYMTRSVHAMENENVIERLNEDKSIELLSVRGLEEVFGVNETVFGQSVPNINF